MLIKILLAGEGGQGVQTIADVISKTAFEKGLVVSSIPNYGLEQRGGVSLSYIKISDEEIIYPRFTHPDILLILSDQARERTKEYQAKSANVIDIEKYKNILEKENIKLQGYNIFFLGVITKLMAEKGILEEKDVFQFLEKKLSTKAGWDENKKAFDFGINLK